MERVGRGKTYDIGERLPSGVSFCFAAPSLKITGALGESVRGVPEDRPRSA